MAIQEQRDSINGVTQDFLVMSERRLYDDGNISSNLAQELAHLLHVAREENRLPRRFMFFVAEPGLLDATPDDLFRAAVINVVEYRQRAFGPTEDERGWLHLMSVLAIDYELSERQQMFVSALEGRNPLDPETWKLVGTVLPKPPEPI